MWLYPQYKGLEELWQTTRTRAWWCSVFPATSSASRSRVTKEAIAEFCELNYGVSFRCSRRSTSTATGAIRCSCAQKTSAGLLGSEAIKWNFTKFLIGKDGQLVKRFAPATKPQDLSREIEALLK